MVVTQNDLVLASRQTLDFILGEDLGVRLVFEGGVGGEVAN